MRYLALLILIPFIALSEVFYVSTSGGGAENNGSISQPWTFTHAITDVSGVIDPGDTIQCRGGTYSSNPYTATQTGIVIMPYPGESAILEDVTGEQVITLSGSGTEFFGFEVRSTSTNGNNNGGIAINAANVIVHSNYVHDIQGAGITSFGNGSESYIDFNVIIGCGSETQAAGYSYGIYSNNSVGATDPKYARGNIVAFGWKHGLHIYGESASLLYLHFIQNTIFNNGVNDVGAHEWNFMIGSGELQAEACTVRANYTYFDPSVDWGNNYVGWTTAATDMQVLNNFWVGTATGTALTWNVTGSNTLTGNVVLGTPVGFNSGTHPSNTYYTEWPYATRDDDVFLVANPHIAKRANITIYNWDTTATVEFDPTGVLSSGDTYYIKNSLNFTGASVASGTWTSGNITIPLTGLTVINLNGSPPRDVFQNKRFFAGVLFGAAGTSGRKIQFIRGG